MSATHTGPAAVAGRIRGMIATAGGTGGYVVRLPEYNPVFARALADSLDLDCHDFRAERMRAHGLAAARLELSALDEALRDWSAGRGTFVNNVESLLATKPSADRRTWLAGFLDASWPSPLVLPLAIFPEDLPERPGRICAVEADEIPADSLLIRLASQ